MDELKQPLNREDFNFQLSIDKLTSLFILDNIEKRRSVEEVEQLGGLEGLCRALHTHPNRGISSSTESIQKRVEVYGSNTPKVRVPPSFCKLVWEAMQDFTLRVLTLAAIVSLVVGTYEDPKKGWMEGLAIIIAITLVVLVTAINDWVKEKQF